MRLVASVRDYFSTFGVTANVELGWNRRTRQTNQGAGGANRVIFVPSDEAGGGGSLARPHLMGPREFFDPSSPTPTRPVATARPLLDWQRVIFFYVWARDPARAEDEGAQIEATETLFEEAVRAIHSAPGGFASLSWGGTKWTPPAERSFGLELRGSLTFQHPLFDRPSEIVYPSAAVIGRAP